MSQHSFWILLSKKLANEATAEELSELEKLITENPEWQYAIQNLEDLWKHEPKRDTLEEEEAYLMHLHRMQDKNVAFDYADEAVPQGKAKVVRIKRSWMIAASIILLLGLGAAFFYMGIVSKKKNSSLLARKEKEISAELGARKRIQLPDGTVVMLNAGSKLSYTREFGNELREVTLVGEGFFDVKRMEDKPFIIHTASINIKVLGTVFNVKAYPEDKRTETSLLKGRIEVTINNRPNDKIILAPSEKLVVENIPAEDSESIAYDPRTVVNEPVSVNVAMSLNKLSYSKADSTVVETQWIYDRLVFRDESFEDLVMQMNRWYNVNIIITNEKLKKKHLSGVFEKENINEALEALKYSLPFRFERKGNTIFIN